MSTDITKARKALRPFEKAMARAFDEIRKGVDESDPVELVEAIGALSETNCSWMAWAAAEYIIKLLPEPYFTEALATRRGQVYVRGLAGFDYVRGINP